MSFIPKISMNASLGTDVTRRPSVLIQKALTAAAVNRATLAMELAASVSELEHAAHLSSKKPKRLLVVY